MEMEDSLLQQMMMTQADLTNQIRQMQQTQTSLNASIRQSDSATSVYQTMPSPKQYTIGQGGLADAKSDQVFENAVGKNSFFQPVAEVADNLLSSRSYLLGAESMQMKQSDTRQKLQMGALNAVGGAAETATSVGGFFVPGGLIASSAVGLGAGALVSYGTKQMVTGAKDALRYQDILEEKGYKAFNVFEGQNDFGGVGMKLDEQQELSSFMRDLEPEKMLNSKEMSSILDGALDGKLLKSTTDLRTFKKKFSEIVDTVKEVSVVMNSSLEEATKMMGELESRGISGGKATMLAAQAKVNASILGVDSKQLMQSNLEQASELSKGSGIDQAKTTSILGEMQYVTTQLNEQYKNSKEDKALYHYIKNNGGEEQIAYQGADLLINGVDKQEGTILKSVIGYAAEMDGNGNLHFDKEKIAKAARGEYGDVQGIIEKSNENFGRMSAAEGEVFLREAGEKMKQELTAPEIAQIYRTLIEQQKEVGGDTRSTAAILQSLTGVQDSALAEIMADQIYNTTYDTSAEFTGLSTKEALHAIKRVNSPGPVPRLKSWWKGTVTNPLGDIGQGVADGVGSVTLELQEAINNVDAKKGIQSDRLLSREAFTDDETYQEKLYTGEKSAAETYNKNIKKLMKTNKKKNAPEEQIIAEPDGAMDYYTASKAFENPHMMKEDMKKLAPDEKNLDAYEFTNKQLKSEEFSKGQYQSMIMRAESGTLALADVAKLRQDLEDGTFKSKESKAMVQDVIDIASGEKEIKDLDPDRVSDFKDGPKGFADLDDGKKNVKQIRKDIEKKMDTIIKDVNKTNKAAKKAAMNLDLSEEDAAKMDRALRTKDYKTLETLTDDKTMLAAVDKMKKADAKLSAGRDASGALADIIDNSAAKADATQSTVDLLVASKAMTKESAQTLFGDVLEQRKALDKGLKGDWSIDRIQQETQLLDDMMEGKVASLSEKEATKFAEGIANLNEADEYTIASLKGESGSIDREKLSAAMESIVVAGAVGGSKAVDKDKDKALGEHKDAMGDMLETLTKETAMIKKATKNLKNGTPFQYSSVTGK